MGDSELRGETAIVIGGTSGIGRAIAERLTDAGVDVVPTSRTEADVAATADALGCDLVYPTDTTNREQVTRLFERVSNQYGEINILINSAGIFFDERPPSEITDTEWQKITMTNLYGVFLSSQISHSYLREGRGVIIHIGSIAGHIPLYGQSAYVATKFGVSGLTKSFAAEYAADGIRVNAVDPGYVKTPQNADALKDEEIKERIEARTPLGRYVTPDEVAATTKFLCSPDASMITGETVLVDGGLSLGAFSRIDR